VDNGFELTFVEKTFHAFFVREIEREEPEARSDAELPEPRIFEPGVVVVIQVVHTDNLESILEKPADDMSANKARRASHENALFSYFNHDSSF
jgi:hypothetical protein